jgi:hypothetical protein
MRYDDSDDDTWQRGRQLKAYLMWNWNSFNSPKFYLCQSREDVNSKHTYCGTGIPSTHQSFIFVRGEGRERDAGKSTMYSATYTS